MSIIKYFVFEERESFYQKQVEGLCDQINQFIAEQGFKKPDADSFESVTEYCGLADSDCIVEPAVISPDRRMLFDLIDITTVFDKTYKFRCMLLVLGKREVEDLFISVYDKVKSSLYVNCSEMREVEISIPDNELEEYIKKYPYFSKISSFLSESSK